MEYIDITRYAYGIVIMLSMERLFGIFYERRRTPLIVLIGSYVIWYILGSYVYFKWNIPIITLSTSIISYFIISLNYESTMKKRIVAVFCCFAFVVIIELFVIITLTAVQINMFTAGDFDLETHHYAVSALLTFVTASLLRRFKNIKKNAIYSPMIWVMSVIIPVSSLAMLILTQTYLPRVISIASTIVVLGINILIFYFLDFFSQSYETKLSVALHAQEKEYYYTQCNIMQESIDNVKSIRHDLKLHLTALQKFTSGNKEATDYLNQLLGDIEQSEIYSDTGNIAFDSIINFKLRNAKTENINVYTEIFIPQKINIETADVVTILGNLLDNAIEAVAKVNNKKIKLNIKYDKGCLLINADNTFDGTINYDNKKTIISIKNESDHGYGLKNIRKAIEKYNGHIDITHDNNVFSVGILLYFP